MNVGDRVALDLPDNLGSRGRKGRMVEVHGTVRSLGAHGVYVDFDEPFNGVMDCYATGWELRPIGEGNAMTFVNVNAEREDVARLLYRFDCFEQGFEDEWQDKDWNDLLVDSERNEYRRKAMLLMDAMVSSLTIAWQRVDESDSKIREVHALCDEPAMEAGVEVPRHWVSVTDLRRVLGGAS